MITGAIAVILGIAAFAAAGNGECGTVAIGAVIIVFVLALGSESRKCDRACNNFVDCWEEGGPDRKRG